MTLQLQIPDSVARAIRLPEKHLQELLLLELAVALYAQEVLSLGKAAELAGVSRVELVRALRDHGAVRHYGREEMEDDLTYARR
jgi:predicted HTH domain antitoxin